MYVKESYLKCLLAITIYAAQEEAASYVLDINIV